LSSTKRHRSRSKWWMSLFFVSIFSCVNTYQYPHVPGWIPRGFIVISILKNKYLFFLPCFISCVVFFVCPGNQVHRAKDYRPFRPHESFAVSHVVKRSENICGPPLAWYRRFRCSRSLCPYKSPDDEEPGGHLITILSCLLSRSALSASPWLLPCLAKYSFVEYRIFRNSTADWLAGSVTLGAFASVHRILLNGLFNGIFGATHKIMVFRSGLPSLGIWHRKAA